MNNKIIHLLALLLMAICSLEAEAQTQHEVQQVQEFLTSKDNNSLNAIPSFYTRDSTKGFRYFSRQWLRGVVFYANNQESSSSSAPLKVDNSRFYNFDKFSNRLVSTEDGKSILNIPNDAVNGFILVDSGKAYVFKKVPVISRTLYLQPIMESERGYSLYKQTDTKLSRADYQNIGYGATGKKYDEYIDSYEYYVVFPGANSFKKISLNASSIRKALKNEGSNPDAFFKENPGAVTEQTLHNLLLYLNTRSEALH